MLTVEALNGHACEKRFERKKNVICLIENVALFLHLKSCTLEYANALEVHPVVRYCI